MNVRSEYEQNHNDTHINIDTKSRAARSETKKYNAKVEKYIKFKIFRIYAGENFEKFSLAEVRSG
jgi:hypothetical protein